MTVYNNHGLPVNVEIPDPPVSSFDPVEVFRVGRLMFGRSEVNRRVERSIGFSKAGRGEGANVQREGGAR